MPYEGQPFQNSIKAYIESKNLKIKVLGYIHSPPLALPLNLINKSTALINYFKRKRSS